MYNYYYLLEADGKTPRAVTFDEWVAFETSHPFEWKRVALDIVGDGVRVSTVFLVHDHSFLEDGPPVLWETMVFGGEHADYQVRYTSYDDAVAGHARALQMVIAEKKET